MKENKFRVWDVDHKKFVYFDLNNPDENLFGRHGYLQNNIPVPVWQEYTGLKDRAGKEIYEGDVVSYMEDLSNPQEVYYSTGYFYPLATFNTDTAVTILGNKYENPRLLPPKKD